MRLLSLYILKMFFKPFLASFAGLCILVMFSQVVDRLDRFMADGVSLSHVLGYLITSLPFQAMNVLPVACLLATLFVVGNLVRTREFIAGMAGGIPPEKFLNGLLLSGFLISVFALVANETIVPPTTRYSREVFREKIRRLGEWEQTVFNDLCVLGAEGRIWNVKVLNTKRGVMERVVVDTLLNGKMTDQVDAMNASWTPQGWQFEKGVTRKFDPSGVNIASFENFDKKVFPFHEKPDDFIIQEPQPEQMNYSNLKKHISRLNSLGVPVRKLQVELMMKLAFPFSCFVVTLLGVPLALKGRGNRAMGIAAGGILTMAYMGFMQFGKALAQRMIPPLAGAWLGNVVFLGLALLLWARMRRSA